MNNVDIVIVGGGMVGLTCALCLAKTPLKIALVDASPQPALPTGEWQHRVSAINQGTESLLRRLHAWPESPRMSPYQGMYVWDQDSFSNISFDAYTMGYEKLGTIVENGLIAYSLWQQATQQGNITLYPKAKVAQWARGDEQSFITLEDGSMLSARLVVGADGGESSIRQQANFAMTHWDYDHHSIIATINSELPHQNIARQVFTPHGPLALLPLAEPNQCSIVWSQNTDVAQLLMEDSDTIFSQKLAVATDMKFGQIALNTPRRKIPLKMRYARQWADNGVVLIGDAAHTFHPLAGLGANLGLMDAAALAQTITANVADGKAYYLHRHLRSYERWRKAEAVKTIALMEGFKRLFDGNDPVKKLIRGVGMFSVNRVTGVKESLIKQAMGITGDIPVMCKP